MGRHKVESKEVVGPDEIVDRFSKASPSHPHLISITGVQYGKEIEIIYSLDDLRGSIVHVATRVPLERPIIDSVSKELSSASIYEQEVHDLFGVTFKGNPLGTSKLLLPDCFPEGLHPGLKEVSSEGVEKTLERTCLESVPSIYVTGASRYSVESAVVLPYGPYHPALKEPERFVFVLEGEKIIDVVPRIGHIHRGIEKLAEARTLLQDLFLVERICGICSFSHSWAFTLAVEELLGMHAPRRAEYLRTLVAELERIHSHLLWIGLIGYWTGFESAFMWIWELRERILNVIDAITGNRVHKSFITFGGTRRDVPDDVLASASKTLSDFERDYERLLDEIMSYEPLVERLRGIGRYSAEQAVRLGAVGPMIRAAGVPYDIRKVDPYGAYGEVGFEVVTGKEGDAYSLLVLRAREVLESVRIARECAEKAPRGENPVPKVPFVGVVKEGETISRVEAPRGELFYYLRGTNARTPHRVKIRTPTLANVALTAAMLRGATLSDVPVVLTAMDPCFSCMDRAVAVDVRTGKSYPLSFDVRR
ncbi:MAG: NADH-quinone oxidoreductase subunit C [Desulfurococcaceae archaeon]